MGFFLFRFRLALIWWPRVGYPLNHVPRILSIFSLRVSDFSAALTDDTSTILSNSLSRRNGTCSISIPLASILEKESGNSTGAVDGSTEREIISGIFYNRLLIGQALESDATINYVTGKDNPAPLTNDLEANSPYNTYKYPGLPPGPISNPSLSSIEAALHPQKSSYYYFLHDQSNGKVYFSKTFDEHLQNKAKYLK